MDWSLKGATDVRELAGQFLDGAASAMGAGPTHRYRLSEMDIRVVISGVRGKSTATTWLHDILHRRGNDTYSKVTGNEPVSIYNGERHEIERSELVRLYENERELR